MSTPAPTPPINLAPDEREELRGKLIRERERRSLLWFLRGNYPGLMEAWFHRVMAAELQEFSEQVERQQSPRLMINMPPGSGKSSTVARALARHLVLYPDHRILMVSYNDQLSSELSLNVRNIVTKYAEFDPRLAPALPWGVTAWRTAAGGGVFAVGRGGTMTGRHVNLFVVDDLLKGEVEADSPVIRDQAWKHYTSGASTRLLPGGGVIYIGTRWHEDDPAGRILKRAEVGGRLFKLLLFPALAERDDEYRKVGEALHPARYDEAWLALQKIEITPRQFAALYQQRPSPEEGNRYKRGWIQHYAAPPVQMAIGAQEVAITVDCAARKGEKNDWTVMQVWARRGVEYYLLDQVRARMIIGEQVDAFRRLCGKWPTAVLKLIETKSNGDALYQIVSKVFGGVVGEDPGGGKEERSKFAERAFEAKQVWLPAPEHAPWIGDFVEEVCSFPLAPHDDQVDAMSQLLKRWVEEGGSNALQRSRERLAIFTADPWD